MEQYKKIKEQKIFSKQNFLTIQFIFKKLLLIYYEKISKYYSLNNIYNTQMNLKLLKNLQY